MYCNGYSDGAQVLSIRSASAHQPHDYLEPVDRKWVSVCDTTS